LRAWPSAIGRKPASRLPRITSAVGRCLAAGCPQQTFAEPLPTEVARRFGRRTARLDGLVGHLGVALSGRPAAGVAQRLMLPVGKDTCCASSVAGRR
jgi:hypothetical protein